jgi:hypothetical protein
MVKCNHCGLELAEDNPGTPRIPCPSCGSTGRLFEAHYSEAIQVSDHLMMERRREGKTLSFGESPRQGRSAFADDNEDGTLSITLSGTSPQGEEDTPHVCRVLIQAMNDQGATWNDPCEPDPSLPGMGDVDGIATNANGGPPLHIQVVKALANQKMWRTLNTTGSLNMPNVAVAELAAELAAAVRKKMSIPHRSRLVLALDANRLPGLAFDSVVNCFREQFGSALTTAGFQSVWIVGPTRSLVKRLDEES